MFKINGSFNGNNKLVIDKNNWVYDHVKEITSKNIKDDGVYLSHLSNCIINVVPLKLEEPTFLYGSKQKTIITNKITIKESLVNKNDPSDIKEGDVLAEFLISDESLSNALFYQGGNASPMTTISLENKKFPLNIEAEENSVVRSEKENTERTNAHSLYIQEAIEKFRDGVKKGKPTKKLIKEVTMTLRSHSSNIKLDAEDNIECLVSNLKGDINSLKYEMFSTVQKLKLYDRAEMLQLENNSNDTDDNNYLSWYVNGGFNKFEKQVLAEVLREINKKEQNLKIKDYVDKLESDVHNSKRKFKTQNASLSIQQISGNTLLSNGVNASNKTVEFRIGLAQKINTGSKTLYTGGREFLRIAFSPEDLILLVRATNKEQFVFGTILHYAGQTVPFVKLQTFIEDKSNINYAFEADNKNLKTLVNKFIQKIEKESFKKEDKIEMEEILKAIEKALGESTEAIEDSALQARNNISKLLEEEVKESLKHQIKGLPEDISQKALSVFK